jgi:hypothetical protein
LFFRAQGSLTAAYWAHETVIGIVVFAPPERDFQNFSGGLPIMMHDLARTAQAFKGVISRPRGTLDM